MQKWDGPTHLKQMLKLNPELDPLASDFDVHMITPAEADTAEEALSGYRTDLGTVLRILKAQENPEAVQNLIAANPQLSEAGLKLIEAVTRVSFSKAARKRSCNDMSEGFKVLFHRAVSR